jgi:hypothetical protein
MLNIKGAVGRRCANNKADAKIIQLLINKKMHQLKPLVKLRVDGIVGSRTIKAIEVFQKKIVNFIKPDGRVDPGGKTFKALAPSYMAFTISGVMIHQKAKEVLTEILLDAGLTAAKVTSGVRTPADQARIMYDNIKRKGVDFNYRLYGKYGDEVLKVYEENATKERTDVIALMESKIQEIGPAKVSKHCSSTHYVFDVAPSSVSNHPCFVTAVKNHKAVSKLLKPPEDPAFHIEILKNSPFL